MKTIFHTYQHSEEIPIRDHIKKRKLIKYFNREISAAMVAVSKLLAGETPDPHTPFYYAKGKVEYEDFGLDKIVEACRDGDQFSQTAFVEKGLSSISPLTQFKVLYNMPLSFISIEYRLVGDNAVLYSSAYGLYMRAVTSPTENEMILGAGKVNRNGTVESGFVLCRKAQIEALPAPEPEQEAIDFIRELNTRANHV